MRAFSPPPSTCSLVYFFRSRIGRSSSPCRPAAPRCPAALAPLHSTDPITATHRLPPGRRRRRHTPTRIYPSQTHLNDSRRTRIYYHHHCMHTSGRSTARAQHMCALAVVSVDTSHCTSIFQYASSKSAFTHRTSLIFDRVIILFGACRIVSLSETKRSARSRSPLAETQGAARSRSPLAESHRTARARRTSLAESKRAVRSSRSHCN